MGQFGDYLLTFDQGRGVLVVSREVLSPESPDTVSYIDVSGHIQLDVEFAGEKVRSHIDDESDGRGRKLIKLTSAGQSNLKKWILTGAEPDVITAVSDPLRTRMFFLDVLSGHERDQYLHELILQMEHYLKETRQRLKHIRENNDSYDYLGSKGATMSTQSRLEWLLHVRDTLKGD